MAEYGGALPDWRHSAPTAIAFQYPVSVGDLVLLDARVTWVGRTSLEVEVSIDAEDVVTGVRHRTSTAFFVYVALGELGDPSPVPPLELRTEEERARFAEAEERRRFRLAQRRRSVSR